jgi:hypothetical protein
VRRKIALWASFLIANIVCTSALAAERYELLFSDASYSSADQHELNYSSFVGDRQTGAIYFCQGTVKLKKTGDLDKHTGSCAYRVPVGSTGEYTFSRLSALDPSTKADKPKMNPAWAFWRIDQVKRQHGFCTRYGDPATWVCFEVPLP